MLGYRFWQRHSMGLKLYLCDTVYILSAVYYYVR